MWRRYGGAVLEIPVEGVMKVPARFGGLRSRAGCLSSAEETINVICSRVGKGVISIIALALVALTATAAPGKPNVILILGDDMGIDAVSAFNSRLGLKTPAIDRLAREGMSFMDAHSTSGVCSPTRYSVLTGRYNWRSRLKRGIVGRWERPLITDARLTLPEMFRGEGYATACIGKWHLGWHWPGKGGGGTQRLAWEPLTRTYFWVAVPPQARAQER